MIHALFTDAEQRQQCFHEVIHLYEADGIARIAMEDRTYKNTFSHQLRDGLMAAFAYIAQSPQIKVVVVHGYDAYFCCGGTKEELIGILEGEVKFTDLRFFDLFLHCELPVIAAMQGHALGGGLALASYADIMVLGRECIYSANFMKYGFTPGMGATHTLPMKFGQVLGAEMLMTAGNYRGEQLRERGVSMQVVPKDQVIATAMGVAEALAQKPRRSLELLKQQLARPLRNCIDEVVERELAMHDESFALPEIRKNIEHLFGR